MNLKSTVGNIGNLTTETNIFKKIIKLNGSNWRIGEENF